MAENSAWPLGLFQKNAMAFWKNLKTRQLKQCIHFFCIEFVVHLQSRNLRLQSRKGDDYTGMTNLKLFACLMIVWWLFILSFSVFSVFFFRISQMGHGTGVNMPWVPLDIVGSSQWISIVIASPCPFGYTKNERLRTPLLGRLNFRNRLVWVWGPGLAIPSPEVFHPIHAPLRWAGARPPNRHRFHAWQAWMRQGARAKF